MKKYYSVELESQMATVFAYELKNAKIEYEMSDCYNLKHLEILADAEEVKFCNDILDIIVG